MTEYTYTQLRGYRIHSLHAGHGPDIILLHGLSGSSRWWRDTVPALSPKFRTHSLDLVGFGRSKGDVPATIAGMADLIVEWMAARKLERAHLMGHSMGGQIAIHVAAKHAALIDRLVLVATAGTPRELSMSQATRFVAEIIPPRAWGRPRFLPTVARDALRAGPLNILRATAHLLRDDVRPLLPRVNAPTLLIWGALDPLTPLRDGKAMAKRIPNARMLVYENAAHMPMIDETERFNRDVLSFLAND